MADVRPLASSGLHIIYEFILITVESQPSRPGRFGRSVIQRASLRSRPRVDGRELKNIRSPSSINLECLGGVCESRLITQFS